MKLWGEVKSIIPSEESLLSNLRRRVIGRVISITSYLSGNLIYEGRSCYLFVRIFLCNA